MPSPGDGAGVRVLAKHASGAAGAQDHGGALEQKYLAGRDLDREHPAYATVLNQEVRAKELVMARDQTVMFRSWYNPPKDVYFSKPAPRAFRGNHSAISCRQRSRA